ncbi:DsbE family thiol:disulfide interchange protein [Vibrio sp. ZSDE26]|uniref:DsbE family thiol:disulfide interchange protein n=1 Tax=Vibrio amylolyticus TaxID=2847292 RepID=A0A9X2BLA5_9VIBR|nr:DsbE family thiol:disulfide interchange protein [Vibrio amylolyticus]MCK6265462.1 DsbE family thiol:disulfide interchange protein [Vibrio amylolyticus]
MSKSKLRNFIILIVVVIGFAAISMVAIVKQGETKTIESEVRPFPSFSTIDLGRDLKATSNDQEMIITEGVLQNRGYQLVNVWATWCSVCRSEHDDLLSLSQQGVTIVGLNYRDDKRAAKQYLKEKSNPYSEVIFDPNGRLAIDLGVVGTPETYLVDNRGMIIKKHVGRLTEKVWQSHFLEYFN